VIASDHLDDQDDDKRQKGQPHAINQLMDRCLTEWDREREEFRQRQNY